MLTVTFICDQCLTCAVAMFSAAARVPDLNLIPSLPQDWIKMLPNPAANNPDKRGRHVCAACAEPLKKADTVVTVSNN